MCHEDSFLLFNNSNYQKFELSGKSIEKILVLGFIEERVLCGSTASGPFLAFPPRRQYYRRTTLNTLLNKRNRRKKKLDLLLYISSIFKNSWKNSLRVISCL
jgi:hypothetical protein